MSLEPYFKHYFHKLCFFLHRCFWTSDDLFSPHHGFDDQHSFGGTLLGKLPANSSRNLQNIPSVLSSSFIIVLHFVEMQRHFSDEYIGEPLERLGAEAERRIDIAQQNFNNAVTTFKTRHDQINRLPIKQILK